MLLILCDCYVSDFVVYYGTLMFLGVVDMNGWSKVSHRWRRWQILATYLYYLTYSPDPFQTASI